MTVLPPGPTREPEPAAAVASAMAALDTLDGRPTAEHVDVFERVHTALSEALASGSG
jgi:hypothetical protein